VLDIINVTELSPTDAQAIYNTIPLDIRKLNFKREAGSTQESVFEIIDNNVSLGTIRQRLRRVLEQLEKQDREAHDMLVMMSYVHECRTVASYDMIYLFIDRAKKEYSDVKLVTDHLGQLIKEYESAYLDNSQDHFVARSSAVANAVVAVCSRDAFRRVFERFHSMISPIVIPNYDIFRRYGYDHHYAEKAFTSVQDGKRFYERLVRQTDNPYDWQHGALYLSEKKQFSEAFQWIERAISKSGSRVFSIRNSHARILFDANIPFATPDDQRVRAALDQSMETLQRCYSADRRKSYHATRFAEQAVQYENIYHDNKSRGYLENAGKWLSEQSQQNEWNRGLQHWSRNVSRALQGT
jgi:hypothetical protein